MGINLKDIIYQYKKHSFFSFGKATKLWLKNRKITYNRISLKHWTKFKTSDTIFLFGSGPSINEITEKQWEVINNNDSFGLNYAFLTKYPTTFFYLGYEPSSNEILTQSFSEEIRSIYKDTLWFVPIKVLYRLMHPRTKPEFFPFDPKIAWFDIPPAINIENERDFKYEDFKKSLLYRGSIGAGIHLIDILGYKNIVLLGVDLHTYRHFYDDFGVMKEERKETYKKNNVSNTNTFDDLLPDKKNKSKTMQEYYHALNKLYFKPKGVQLYVGNKDNLLSPQIPYFPGFK